MVYLLDTMLSSTVSLYEYLSDDLSGDRSHLNRREGAEHLLKAEDVEHVAPEQASSSVAQSGHRSHQRLELVRLLSTRPRRRNNAAHLVGQ